MLKKMLKYAMKVLKIENKKKQNNFIETIKSYFKQKHLLDAIMPIYYVIQIRLTKKIH